AVGPGLRVPGNRTVFHHQAAAVVEVDAAAPAARRVAGHGRVPHRQRAVRADADAASAVGAGAGHRTIAGDYRIENGDVLVVREDAGPVRVAEVAAGYRHPGKGGVDHRGRRIADAEDA